MWRYKEALWHIGPTAEGAPCRFAHGSCIVCLCAHRVHMVCLMHAWVFPTRPQSARRASKLSANRTVCDQEPGVRKKVQDCAGHFGFIRLELPVYHVGFFKHTLNILQSICKRCSRILLSRTDRLDHLQKMRNPLKDILSKTSALKKIIERAKKVSTCPYCDYPNGVVKKVSQRARSQHLLRYSCMLGPASQHGVEGRA
jgi:hypothetical protein